MRSGALLCRLLNSGQPTLPLRQRKKIQKMLPGETMMKANNKKA
jgi:hypothetical protein